MNAIRALKDLPFIEYSPIGCVPMASITAPNVRDDGLVSFRQNSSKKGLHSLTLFARFNSVDADTSRTQTSKIWALRPKEGRSVSAGEFQFLRFLLSDVLAAINKVMGARVRRCQEKTCLPVRVMPNLVSRDPIVISSNRESVLKSISSNGTGD